MPRDRTSRRPEFLIGLAPAGRGPMHLQIQRALREAIRARRLRPGTTVPSTRTLADDLGVSRGVVVQAYDQLIAEGYLVATPGSTTRVTTSLRAACVPDREPEPTTTFEIDFRPGHPDLRTFPQSGWKRSFLAVFRSLGPEHLGYIDPRGTSECRSALVDYLVRARGVVGSANQLIVCTGCAQALSVAARVLRQEGVGRIALEDPGHREIGSIVLEAGLTTVSVPVDDDGLDVDALERTRARAVILSPAHQNPLGGVLSPPRRQQLLAWAARTDGFIVEDDYDAEYRYDRQAVGALQGLAPERILYAGSASKILAPGLRLGWLLACGRLVERAVTAKRDLDNGSPVIDQLTYARFVDSGELDRHLRRMRRQYRARRDALLKALARHCPDWRIRGAAAGLHLVAEPPPQVDLAQMVKRAARRSVHVYPLSDYGGQGSGPRGLVFGYANLSESEIAEGIRRFAERTL
jgi:GntR family transcriptional regulator/MocR family aminotransferase